MLTLTGLRVLWKDLRRGRPLPDDWSIQAQDYLKTKRMMVEKFNRDWDKAQLKEAESIVNMLYRGGRRYG